ncbi:MAG: site-2 protease family protein [Bacteroidia bacterium]|nr:site-2 protease family protein [Bacteroidia bacterium]MCX7652049.1 site-2 protease family protein [Bacteroidia bacterium]MDW8416280.1 site-2 protease family protein [Bacteroidia bacterium]
MSRFTVRIAVVSGIPIYIHWSFWLLIAWVILSSIFSGQADTEYLLWRLVLMSGLVLSVILHELGHAMAAKAFGIPTRDITMYPFGGVASVARIPDKPIQELIVAVAGPLVNFIIVGLSAVWLRIAGGAMHWHADDLLYVEGQSFTLRRLIVSLSVMNMVLAIFNLLPAFPMDGGRVLRALLATRLSYMKATHIAALIGQGFAVLFIIFGIYSNPFLILIGFFVFVAAAQERQQVEERTAMYGFVVADALLRDIPTLTVSQTLEDAIQKLLNTQVRSFLIVDPWGMPAGSLSREQIIQSLSEGRPRTTSLVQVMDSELLLVPPTMPLNEGYQLLNEHQKPFLVVVQDNRLLGIVDAENIAEFLLIRRATQVAK